MDTKIRLAPLRDRDSDASLFVAQEGFDRMLRAALAGLNVLVLAPRGGGKTTALRQLQLRLRKEVPAGEVVFADLAGLTEPGSALQMLVALASEQLGDSLPWKPP